MAARSCNWFLALQPTIAATAQVSELKARLRRESGIAGREVSRDRLHISLRLLEDQDETRDEFVARTAAAVKDVTMPPFVVALNRVVGWRGDEYRQPLVLTGDDGVIGIDLLLDQINFGLAKAGILARPKGFGTPHMTLLYGKVAGFQRIIEPVNWLVRDFVLIESHIGESRHVVLFRQELGGAHTGSAVEGRNVDQSIASRDSLAVS